MIRRNKYSTVQNTQSETPLASDGVRGGEGVNHQLAARRTAEAGISVAGLSANQCTHSGERARTPRRLIQEQAEHQGTRGRDKSFTVTRHIGGENSTSPPPSTRPATYLSSPLRQTEWNAGVRGKHIQPNIASYFRTLRQTASRGGR